MKRAIWTLLVLAALVAMGITGYRLGRSDPVRTGPSMAEIVPSEAGGPTIYYQDPDGRPSYSLEQKSTLDGRPYRAVRAGEDISFDDQSETVRPSFRTRTSGPRQILYYRNPMGLPDISKTPKKDPMGMDYIAVYEGEEPDDVTVQLSPGKLQRIGVKSERVALQPIAERVRAPGTIQLDERRIAVVTLRAEAYVDAVENVTSGSDVRKGQSLMRVYSPTIAQAAADYAATLGPRGDALVPRGARQRLLDYFAVPAQFLLEIERTREVPRTFAVPSPRDGIVVERNVSDGMRVMPGDVLFKVADHALVWALVDVAERSLGAVSEGKPAIVRARSYPDRAFAGKVTLVYPHLTAATRTVRVRIELPNSDLLLKPEMYVEADIDAGTGEAVVAVPDSAVVDSGDRRIVIVDKGEGRFEPRAVETGRRGAGYVEVRSGLKQGENVVTTANFLIDAESNLRSALKSLGGTEAAP